MKKDRKSPARGFTLVEMMIAIVVLGSGILAVFPLFAITLSNMQLAQENLIARQKAQQALESILAARNDAQVTFGQLLNVSAGGIILNGFQPMYDPPGADGIVNTADDATSANSKLDAIVLPGPDGILGTADDVIMPLTNFQRQVTIAPILLPDGTPSPTIRTITVTVQYQVPKFGQRQYSVTSYLSSFR